MSGVAVDKRPRYLLAMLFIGAVVGLPLGFLGLQQHATNLTWLSALFFTISVVLFIGGMVFPFKRDQFWFSYTLHRLGRIGWARRFGINQYAEGAIDLAILNEAWGAYIQTTVGAGSYVINNLAEISYGIFAITWLLYSVHMHFQRLRTLKAMSKIVDTEQQSIYIEKVEKLTTSFSKYSIVIGVVGAVLVNILTVLWIDPQDNALNRMSFYVTTPWTQQPRFAIIFPNTIIPYILGRFSLGAFYGFLAVIGGLVIWTTVLLLWLTSGEIRTTFEIYDADCLRPAEELLNSFWSMTGAGLLLVPLATFMSLNLTEAGSAAAGRWMSYMSWTYILFFVGFFFFSLTKFYSFVSMSKRPVENQIRKELELAIDHKYDPDKIEALKIKMQLLHGHKRRPTITTIMQIAQMVLIITLNFVIKLLES